MKAYIVRKSVPVEPLAGSAGECLIGNRRLDLLQQKALRSQKIEPEFVGADQPIDDREPHLILGDSVYFTPELVGEFLSRSQQAGVPTVCALRRGLTAQRTIIQTQSVLCEDDHVIYDFRFVPAEGRRASDPVPVVIDPDGSVEHLNVPEHLFGCSSYEIPLTDKVVMQIDHWANVWAANIITLFIALARIQKMPKRKLLLAAVRARSVNRWSVLSGMNSIGKNCDIHPTAYVEGSTIAAGARLGAGAVVRESTVGEGAFIGNGVTVEESVVGERCTVLHGHIMYSVLYPGVFTVAQMISASLVGRDVFMGSGVTLTDFRLDGRPVEVMQDGRKVDTGSGFLGCCVGNGAYLGSGCVVAPGRVVPSGLHVAPTRDRVFTASANDATSEAFRQIKAD